MKRFLVASTILIMGFSGFTLQAQVSNRFKKEVDFNKHLQDLQLYEESVLHLQQVMEKMDLLPAQRDSALFFMGNSLYQQQQNVKAIRAFTQLSKKEHPYFNRAKFTEAFLNSYEQQVAQSDSVLRGFSPKKEIERDLKHFQQATNALLARKYTTYDSLIEKVSGKYYAFSKPIKNLNQARIDLADFKRKSTFLAAGMSAIIPGSGKMYAGKLGEGIASLLQCTFLGLQTLEAWNKKPEIQNNPRLWIYGGLFSVFYVGNIWGSALSVHVRRKEFYDTVDQSVYVDMHIPLRTIFR